MELKLLRDMIDSSQAVGLKGGKVVEWSECPKIAVTVKKTGDYLSFIIPFDRFPYVLDRITLERHDCDRAGPDCDDLLLPDLRSRLAPAPVILKDLKQGDYRLEGEHLQAV